MPSPNGKTRKERVTVKMGTKDIRDIYSTETRVISLISGGLDSSLATIKLVENGLITIPMFVDYGQYPREKEYTAVQKVVNSVREKNSLLEELVVISADLKPETGKVGSLWGRAIMMVGLASSWAYIHGDCYQFIALGNHLGDVGPDCKPGGFDKALNETLRIATKDHMRVVLPIDDLTVEDIGKELVSFLSLWEVYSCYWDTPCGFRSKNDTYRCPGCRRKSIAMKAAGYGDVPRSNCQVASYQSPLAEKLGY